MGGHLPDALPGELTGLAPERATEPERTKPPVHIRSVLVPVLVATLAFWLVSATSVYVLTRGAREPFTRTIEIPAGTVDQIARGENPLAIPASWDFFVGDRIIMQNDDWVSHQIGPWSAPSGETIAVSLTEVRGGSLFCSIHPDGQIVLEVRPHGFDWELTILPTLILGPTVGVLYVGIRRLLWALDDEEVAR